MTILQDLPAGPVPVDREMADRPEPPIAVRSRPAPAADADADAVVGSTADAPAGSTAIRARRRSRVRLPRTELTPVLARSVAALFVVSVITVSAAEPAPNGSAPVAPFWVDLIDLGAFVALIAAVVGLFAVRRGALRAGVVAGLGLLTLTVLCPATDHHEIASWWWEQLAVSAGILAVSAALLRMTRPVRRS